MKVIVDTCVWSLALRRDTQKSDPTVAEFRRMIQGYRVQMIGPIRQEILSGIRNEAQFKRLKKYLDSFPDLPAVTEDYVAAATYFNRCRSKGVQGSNTDFLICAMANRNRLAIFTTDNDFKLFSKHIKIALHKTAASN